MTIIDSAATRLAADYERDGFVIYPTPLLPADLLARASVQMDAVIRGEYETGPDPVGLERSPVSGPDALIKIDQAHTADRTLFELVSHPAIGEFAAAVLGADMVQLWTTQLLYKPASGATTGNVGWHQDQHYWQNWWTGEVFTVWLAIEDVTSDMGPLRFVSGSKLWGLRDAGDFFSADLDGLRAAMKADGQLWQETASVLPAGGVSMHHKLTVHGSGANHSARPRRGFALHLRTDRSERAPGATHPYTTWTDDPAVNPVLFSR